MRLTLKKHTSMKVHARFKKKIRIRKRLKGTPERPRLSVFRSSRHIYAQIVDDSKGVTLVAASTLSFDADKQSGKEAAKAVGMTIAKQALSKEIKAVVFDRNGYVYHGRIQSLAEGAREGGLNF